MLPAECLRRCCDTYSLIKTKEKWQIGEQELTVLTVINSINLLVF